MSLMKKAAALAASPQGRQILNKAKRWAEQPENRERLQSMGERVIGRRSPGWPQRRPERGADPAAPDASAGPDRRA